jgi:hypothetical protein
MGNTAKGLAQNTGLNGGGKIRQSQETIAHRSLDYLVARLSISPSPYSLAWAVIALSAYGYAGADRLRRQLEAATIPQMATLPARVLAIAALALEEPPSKIAVSC